MSRSSVSMLSCPNSTFGFNKHCFKKTTEEVRKFSHKIETESSEFARGKKLRWLELFRKEVTVSDLTRLVVPKKDALKYFPPVEGDKSDIDLQIVDEHFKVWNIRFSYRKQSGGAFKLTTHWPQFAKEKNLVPKDVIIFYGPLGLGELYAVHIARHQRQADSCFDACLDLNLHPEECFDACVGPCFNVNHGLQLDLDRRFGDHSTITGKRKIDASGENYGADGKKIKLLGMVLYCQNDTA
ncbi:B3 DNA binding domain [Dillenia turbinata]|uniref:B3 DNA binding domain n=1 Tax=Dillenia turbinata TaxID=194707 RepID=A0AAN8W7F3_9MAGN